MTKLKEFAIPVVFAIQNGLFRRSNVELRKKIGVVAEPQVRSAGSEKCRGKKGMSLAVATPKSRMRANSLKNRCKFRRGLR